MTKSRLWLLLVLAMACPRAAFAQGGLWDALESLSGPGPFHGFTVSGRIFCLDAEGRPRPCVSDVDDNIKEVVKVEVSIPYLTSGDNPRFFDTPNDTRSVHVFKLSGFYQYRFHPIVDLGVGIGVFRFSGDGVTPFSRLTLTPLKLTVTPFGLVRRTPNARRWGRVLRIEYAETFMTTGVTSSQFDSRSIYSKGGEFLSNFGIGFDVGAFLTR